MSHRHHVKPKHAGGRDIESNLTPPIPVVRHAMFHWCEWQRTGNEFDRIAWRSLSGLIDKEEARVSANKEWHKRKLLDGTHPLLNSNRTWDQSETAKKAAKTQLESGVLNLLNFNTTKEHSLRVSAYQKARVEGRTHHFLSGNETWDRSAVSRETSRRRVLDGTLPLLPQNRTWDQSSLAKQSRANMSSKKVVEMVRKQTVNRRINAGWTEEKLVFVLNQLPLSSNKLLKLCQTQYEWPSSRGVIQNILRVLEEEGLQNVFNFDFLPA